MSEHYDPDYIRESFDSWDEYFDGMYELYCEERDSKSNNDEDLSELEDIEDIFND